MKRSEKQLASVLLACLGIFVVIPWIWGVFRGPVEAQESALERAETKLEKTQDAFEIARASIQSMRAYREQSLSSNSAEGALAYQQWLTDLAEIVADFSGAEVIPERISPSRDNSYVAVRLRVTGEGTVEQLRTFLYRFHRANVLHRITSMVAEAQNNSSRPKLTIRITTEAIALRDAPAKGPTLFPRTKVVSINSDDGPPRLEVQSVEGFPETTPFELRIGQNYYSVADVNGNTLLLQKDEGQDIEAGTDDIVELSIVHPDFDGIAITEYDELIEKNPFAKPAPYRPRLDLIGSKKVGRGEKMSLAAKVSGVDVDAGDVEFDVLSDLVAGMSFESGKLEWEPPADFSAGDYSVKIRAAGGGLKEPIESEFTLTLSDVNEPPSITIPENLVATLGQAMVTKLEATDPETPAEELKFTLGEGAPEGAVLNAETRELTFTPPAEGEPGDVTIHVTVTDAGDPAQATTVAVKVVVEDDKAQFTFMEGVVAADSVPEAWLRDKSTNTKIVLHEGDDLKYAGFDAIVLSIGNDFLLMQQADETIRLNVGQNLRQSTVIAKLDPPEGDSSSNEDARPEAPPEPEGSESKAGTDVTAELPANTDAKEQPEPGTAATPSASEVSQPASPKVNEASSATDSGSEQGDGPAKDTGQADSTDDAASDDDQPTGTESEHGSDDKPETDKE